VQAEACEALSGSAILIGYAQHEALANSFLPGLNMKIEILATFGDADDPGVRQLLDALSALPDPVSATFASSKLPDLEHPAHETLLVPSEETFLEHRREQQEARVRAQTETLLSGKETRARVHSFEVRGTASTTPAEIVDLVRVLIPWATAGLVARSVVVKAIETLTTEWVKRRYEARPETQTRTFVELYGPDDKPIKGGDRSRSAVVSEAA